jgi:hypothetical protein
VALSSTTLPPALARETAAGGNKQPRRAQTHRASIALLPGPVGEVFQVDGVAQGQDTVRQLPVAAPTRGRELPMHLASLGLDLPLAVRDLPALLTRFDASALVIVLRVIGPALAIQLPVQAAQRLGIRSLPDTFSRSGGRRRGQPLCGGTTNNG